MSLYVLCCVLVLYCGLAHCLCFIDGLMLCFICIDHPRNEADPGEGGERGQSQEGEAAAGGAEVPAGTGRPTECAEGAFEGCTEE